MDTLPQPLNVCKNVGSPNRRSAASLSGYTTLSCWCALFAHRRQVCAPTIAGGR
jgi:hypothetical protein